jgi:hypothetical protein
MVAWDSTALTQPDRRQAPREDVYYRTRASAPGFGSVSVQIVDISANGFMARTDAGFAAGDTLTVRLPVVGEINAEVRWALGGRIGCQFSRMIALAPYLELLGTLVKDAR